MASICMQELTVQKQLYCGDNVVVRLVRLEVKQYKLDDFGWMPAREDK
jgi:hypothetical protein